ncbi:hypothetical protein NKH75_31600 [Mesorhizobium sp. M0984]|uniref:hypothetical protein n=1 Tax=Mesorhizobium sp. M0984 TaxID=2957041 RepID=UPI0033362BEA
MGQTAAGLAGPRITTLASRGYGSCEGLVSGFRQDCRPPGKFGWKVRSTDYFKTLDACRLVVNVYKHGAGKSLDDLKKTCSEYLDDPLKGTRPPWSEKLLNHTHLKVSDDQFQTFSDAIVAFWRDVPAMP